MAFGFQRGSSFILEDTLSDPSGRFLFLKGSLGNISCTFANFHAPNQGQGSFLSATLLKLWDFASGCIVLAGDFNVPLDPHLDTSRGNSCIPYRRLALIRRRLLEAQLMNAWRIMHPRERFHSLFAPTSVLFENRLFFY